MGELAQELKATLAELVAIDSTSARSNLPVIQVLERRLFRAGLTCQRQSWRDDAGVEKANLFVRAGAESAELVLVGHTDCVPFDPAWSDALLLREEGGRLYGRGACDNKAFLACVLHAVERVGPRAGLSLAFTADEEVGCQGAKRLVGAGWARARFALIGEPTGLVPVYANKGYCLAEVTVVGKEGHSAYPEAGVSAIFGAARLVSWLEEAAGGELRREVDERFSPPHTTLNVGIIEGGRAKNIIPGQCRMLVEWRPLPGVPVDGGLALLERLAKRLREVGGGFEVQVRPRRLDAGAQTELTSPLVEFLSRETGAAPATRAFGTEALQLSSLGAQTVVFGPGDIKSAHQTGEFVSVDQLLRAEGILENAIRHFCP